MENKTKLIYSEVKRILNLDESGKIISITSDPINTYTADSQILKIKYTVNKKTKYDTIYMKRSNLKNSYHISSLNEIDFYNIIKKYNDISYLIPNCHTSSIYNSNCETLLILEDLSKNFYTIQNSNMIDQDIILCACNALAILHSFFWEHQDLDKIKLIKRTIKIDLIEAHFCIQKFIKDNYTRLSKKMISIIMTAFKLYENTLIEEYNRVKLNKNITIINGDAHIYNYMFPKIISNKLECKIIDFQFWDIGIGCRDLAHLTRKLNNGFVDKDTHVFAVKYYYELLTKYGVVNYSFEQCYDDYKKSVASLILNPIWQYSKYNLQFDICIKPMNNLIKNYKELI